VYVSGGVQCDAVVDTLLCYDPDKNIWENKAAMQSGMFRHSILLVMCLQHQ
jgi:hypothetical protein